MLSGDGDNDTIRGGPGDDYLYGNDGHDTMYGDNNAGTAGGVGNDILYGGPGNDTMNGGGGDDTFDGEGDTDMMYGETGNDTRPARPRGATGHWLYGEGGDDGRSSAGRERLPLRRGGRFPVRQRGRRAGDNSSWWGGERIDHSGGAGRLHARGRDDFLYGEDARRALRERVRP